MVTIQNLPNRVWTFLFLPMLINIGNFPFLLFANMKDQKQIALMYISDDR